MRSFRRVLYLARHAAVLWRSGQLRFRLETFGLYYPALPYRSPWWRINPGATLLLLRQIRSYARWVVEMEELRREGSAAWWADRQSQK